MGGFVKRARYAGEIIHYAGAVAPAGTLVCDGSRVATATYPALFAAIGHAYANAGDNTADGNFRLPDGKRWMRQADYAGGYTVGTKGGASSVTLGVSNLPDHVHKRNVDGDTEQVLDSQSGGTNGTTGTGSSIDRTLTNTGGVVSGSLGQPIDITPAYQTVLILIVT